MARAVPRSRAARSSDRNELAQGARGPLAGNGGPGQERRTLPAAAGLARNVRVIGRGQEAESVRDKSERPRTGSVAAAAAIPVISVVGSPLVFAARSPHDGRREHERRREQQRPVETAGQRRRPGRARGQQRGGPRGRRGRADRQPERAADLERRGDHRPGQPGQRRRHPRVRREPAGQRGQREQRGAGDQRQFTALGRADAHDLDVEATQCNRSQAGRWYGQARVDTLGAGHAALPPGSVGVILGAQRSAKADKSAKGCRPWLGSLRVGSLDCCSGCVSGRE